MVGRTLAGSLGLIADFDLGENGWKDDMDNNLLWLSVLTQGRVTDVLTTLPASPAQGDVVVLAAGHATNPNKIAAYDEGAWKYRAPLAGWRVFNVTLGVFMQFSGTAWVNDTAGLNAEDVRDVMAAALSNGSNVNIVSNDAADTITINAIGDGAGLDAEGVRDVIGAALVQSGLATVAVNDAGDTITVGATGDGTGLTSEQVMDQIAAMLQQGSNVTLTYNDAGDTLTIAAAGAAAVVNAYRAGWFYTSALAASEVVMIHAFTKAVTFPANFGGSVAAVGGTMPGATLVLDVQKNNVSVGSLSISTAGVATFTSTGGTAVAFAIGDRLKVVGPATVNTATNVSGTFEGTF